jgi:hypothetical protein
MSIKPIKIGVSGSLAALVACGIWFIVTGQTEKISQRANDAHANYLASERARENGVTVAEMKRRAYAGCNFPVKQGEYQPGLFGTNMAQADADASRQSCITSYIYGDGIMYSSPFYLSLEWIIALGKILAFSAAVGIALAVIFKIVPQTLRSWWRWLNAE